MKLCIVLFILLVVFNVGYFYKHPLIKVVGDSMYPTFKNGEYLHARRIKSNEDLVRNHVYVFTSPTGEIVIKRLKFITQHGLYFIGDNTSCSYDSRSYGYVPRETVIAEVIYP